MNNSSQTFLFFFVLIGLILLVHQFSKSKSSIFLRKPEYLRLKDNWNQWKQQMGKIYSTVEEVQRFRIFSDNIKFIEDHNELFKQGKSSFFLKENRFADLTHEEFKNIAIRGFKKQNNNTNIQYLNTQNLTQEINWVTKNAVTEVKNQGYCQSGWAFSTTGSLEGLHAISQQNLLSMSEQQLIDCSKSYGNLGCEGGIMYYGFEYVQINGITSEAKYSYKGLDEPCLYDKSEEVFRNSGFQTVPQNSQAQLMAGIAQQPVSVAIQASSLWFQFYQGGIFDDPTCGTDLDHGVLAVGYGTESGKGYYLVKNSWGSSWGSNGYILISNNDPNGPGMCGIQMQASYPTL